MSRIPCIDPRLLFALVVLVAALAAVVLGDGGAPLGS